MTFKEIRQEVELIFDKYRQHKYYTLFMSDVNISITSKIDTVGGGRSNKTSDSTADAAIKLADEKAKAAKYVEIVEAAVDQLPDIERELIQHRYMSRDHQYINDYTVYEVKLFISAPHYNKLRKRAFSKLFMMLCNLI